MREIVVPSFVNMSQPLAVTLSELAAGGVRLVELLADAPHKHIDLTDGAAVAALPQAIEGLPISIHAVHCGFSWPTHEAWDISQPDKGKRAAAVRNCAQVIEGAAKLSVAYMTLHPGIQERGEERLTNSRASLLQLAETARQAGMRIAVENLPPDHLGGSLAEMNYLLGGIDPEVVGYCHDTGHAKLGRDQVGDYIRALGQRMLAVHWHANDGKEDQHLFPDPRDPQWDEFVGALDAIGWDRPVTVEAVPPPSVPLEETLRSVRAVLNRAHPRATGYLRPLEAQ